MKNIKAVIFDFDGTLYDHKGAVRKLLKELKFSHKLLAGAERKVRSRLKGIYTGDRQSFDERFFYEFSRIVKKSPRDLQDWYDSVYLEAMITSLKKNFKARANVNSLLTFLKEQKIKTAVYSDYSKTKERMEALNINTAAVTGIFNAEDLGGLKPAVQLLYKITEELKVKPEETLFIGDRSDTDGKGALAAGMNYIQVLTHKTKKNEETLTWVEICQIIQAHFLKNE
ncbi:HAD family hydrolase [Treponema sp.]|uniref:HAD family hydrolase n=1 Tax=Treponema sp. TaxID=166 RepID=UPI00257A2342|nr:HAD family hydrolase [Treponema sp.]MBE6354970.1 HAD family hydrolase [Treponema sp.]